MEAEILLTLIKWFKEMGINTLGEMRCFILNCTDGTNRDILNKAHGCYIYECI